MNTNDTQAAIDKAIIEARDALHASDTLTPTSQDERDLFVIHADDFTHLAQTIVLTAITPITEGIAAHLRDAAIKEWRENGCGGAAILTIDEIEEATLTFTSQATQTTGHQHITDERDHRSGHEQTNDGSAK